MLLRFLQLGMATPDSSLQRLLADAIIAHLPLKDVRVLLDHGARADGVVTRGLRALHYAAMEDDAAAITELVRRGANVNAEDDVGYTPLHVACKHGRLASSRALVAARAVINFDDDDVGISEASRIMASLTLSPMNLAIENNHVDCVRLLLQNGGNPNQVYFLGRELNLTPLENVGCLELLLQHGADPDSFGRSGLTALMKACKQQDAAAASLLLRHGADVDVQCPARFDRKTALHFATLSGNVPIVRLLLEAGASTRVPHDYKHAPLELAITQDKYAVCSALLDHGADANEPNADGCSPLQAACASLGLKYAMEIVEALLRHGADPNYACKYFSYISPSLAPLVEYLSYNSEYDARVVELLLMYGARVSICRPANVVKIYDAAGVLSHVRKLRQYGDITTMLVEAAGRFDVGAIQNEISLTDGQREMLMKAATMPKTLKHSSRLLIRRLVPIPLVENVRSLPLPPLLQKFVLCQKSHSLNHEQLPN